MDVFEDVVPDHPHRLENPKARGQRIVIELDRDRIGDSGPRTADHARLRTHPDIRARLVHELEAVVDAAVRERIEAEGTRDHREVGS